jgi:hypothetical protein
MSNPYEDKILDWWYDRDLDTYFTMIEKPDGQLRLVITSNPKEEPKDAI